MGCGQDLQSTSVQTNPARFRSLVLENPRRGHQSALMRLPNHNQQILLTERNFLHTIFNRNLRINQHLRR